MNLHTVVRVSRKFTKAIGTEEWYRTGKLLVEHKTSAAEAFTDLLLMFPCAISVLI